MNTKTEYQKKSEKLHAAVVAMYVDLKAQYPDKTPFYLMGIVSRKTKLTVNGVRGMLLREGVYEKVKRGQ